MRNVQRPSLSHIHMPADGGKDQAHFLRFISQLPRLRRLRRLALGSPYFLLGRLRLMLR